MEKKELDNYCHLKKKILSLKLQMEFNTVMNCIKSIETKRTFFIREMHGIACLSKTLYSSFNENLECVLIFPKRKGDILELNDFMTKNIDTNNIMNNNYAFKVKKIKNEGWINYKKVIFRFKLLNKEQNSQNVNNNINSKNENSNFIELTVSFYLDIVDNSIFIINEFSYDLNENIFLRFYDVAEIYYKKLKSFIEKNFKIYFCTESILINRSITQIFNYIMSLKIFHNNRFKLKNIQKLKNEINIYIDIRDKSYPDSVYQTRCHILKLSNISSFISIITLVDVKYFDLIKRLDTLKAAIIVVLKILKKKIEKEIIEC